MQTRIPGPSTRSSSTTEAKTTTKTATTLDVSRAVAASDGTEGIWKFQWISAADRLKIET